MKHFVLAGLLIIVLAATGCVGYRPATSPYYTTFYNTYDAFNNCYYHPGFYGYGYRHHHHDGINGRNRWNGSRGSGGSSGGGHVSSSSSHHSGGGGSSHSNGGGHSSGGNHSSGGGHSGGGSHK